LCTGELLLLGFDVPLLWHSWVFCVGSGRNQVQSQQLVPALVNMNIACCVVSCLLQLRLVLLTGTVIESCVWHTAISHEEFFYCTGFHWLT
jgi:hypothetical protein